MIELTAVVITRNEETNLPRCLDALKFADEIIVLDNGSTDRTVEIARARGVQVRTIDWHGFGPAKQTGVDSARGKWILSVDADEVVSPELASEIRKAIESDKFAGYQIPRLTSFLGKWIRHSGWYPDHVLRLFRKDKGRFDGAVVHEQVVVDGSIGSLQSDLLHYSYPTLEQYFAKFDRYTTIGAEQALAQGRRATTFDLTIRPAAAFLKHFVARQGFLDGIEGLMISSFSSLAVMVKYAKLRQLNRNGGGN